MITLRSRKKLKPPPKSPWQLHAVARALRTKCESLSAQVHNQDLALFRQEKRTLMLQHQKKVLLEHLRFMEYSRLHRRVNLVQEIKETLRKWFTPQHPEEFLPRDDPLWRIAPMPPPKKRPRILVTNIYRRNQFQRKK